MNVCIFSGYLLEKPELRSSAAGKSVCEFRMNVPRDYRSTTGERLSDFVSAVAWGKTAEIIAENCDRGTKLILTTHVRTELYTDKNGIKRESHKYEIDRFEFAERKSSQVPPDVGAQVSEGAGVSEGPAVSAQFDSNGNTDELPF